VLSFSEVGNIRVFYGGRGGLASGRMGQVQRADRIVMKNARLVKPVLL
jgi:hypothetical protein